MRSRPLFCRENREQYWVQSLHWKNFVCWSTSKSLNCSHFVVFSRFLTYSQQRLLQDVVTNDWQLIGILYAVSRLIGGCEDGWARSHCWVLSDSVASWATSKSFILLKKTITTALSWEINLLEGHWTPVLLFCFDFWTTTTKAATNDSGFASRAVKQKVRLRVRGRSRLNVHWTF